MKGKCDAAITYKEDVTSALYGAASAATRTMARLDVDMDKHENMWLGEELSLSTM